MTSESSHMPDKTLPSRAARAAGCADTPGDNKPTSTQPTVLTSFKRNSFYMILTRIVPYAQVAKVLAPR